MEKEKIYFMARKIRFCKLHSRYHVMLRGISGQNIFADDIDRVRLCLFLQAASEKHDFLIHAFCFMQNHLHFIFEPKQSRLYECVQAFASRYAQYFNRRHTRKGYLFQGRFRSILVDDGMYLKRLVRYIHLNPHEAFLVNHPEEYHWSSHRAYLGINDFTWLAKDLVLSRFASNQNEAVQRYIEFTQPDSEAKTDAKNIMTAFSLGIYGSDDFIKEKIPMIEQKSVQRVPKVLSLEEALSHVCHKYQVNLKDLSSDNKKKHIVEARSTLALLGRIGQQNWNLQDVATLLNKNHGSISRLASKAKTKSELVCFAHSLLLS